ncbi:glycosyltransferase [Acidithiobacillus sp. MC6.1]|nr:glycosyltransferase [Acidithiobacillus sp. MC6.1]
MNSWHIYRWLRQNESNFDHIIFTDENALAYYFLLAKGQGFAFSNLRCTVWLKNSCMWQMENALQLPDEVDAIDQDFMEREIARRADALLISSDELQKWIHTQGWLLPQNNWIIPTANSEQSDFWDTCIQYIIALEDSNQITSQPEQNSALVSVCLVHHERPEMLSRALDSLRNQTYSNIEIILVDDGSHSEVAAAYLDALEEEFGEKHWQIIRQKNLYLGAARNAAAKAAHGQYLLFMDDDNIAMPNEIAFFIEAMQHAQADILTTPSALFADEDWPLLRVERMWLPVGGASAAGLYQNVFGDANAFWITSVFHAVGGYTEDYGLGFEDWELFARAVLAGYHLEVVPEPLFWYRINARSMLNTGDLYKNQARVMRSYAQNGLYGFAAATAYAMQLQLRRADDTLPPRNAHEVKQYARWELALGRLNDAYETLAEEQRRLQNHRELALGRLNDAYETLAEEQRRLQNHNEELTASLWTKTQESAWFKEQLLGIQCSRSWRLTRPVRALAEVARHRLRSRPSVTAEPEENIPYPQKDIQHLPSQATTPRPQVWPKTVSTSHTGMRVLIVTPDVVGPIRNGGIGTAFAALTLFAARAGLRVSILYTLGQHSEHWSIADCEAFYAQGGVTFIPLTQLKDTPHIDAPWPRRNAYGVYAWLKSHGADYDLIVFPEWQAEAYYAVLARHQGLMLQHAQIWVNTHGPSAWSMEGNYQLPNDIDLIDLDFMERETVRLADGIISPSAYLLDWMRRHQWQLPQKSLVIQNLMEEDGVVGPNATNDHIPADELVFFGRLEPRKGLIIFCDAIDRLTPALRVRLRQITFMGKALPVDVFDSITYIQTRAKAWNIPIRIQTEFDREQALDYLTESSLRLAIIASLVENLPYTVLECLHHGIRFLATGIGGIPELIDLADQDRVLFPPRPSALARLLAGAISEGMAPAHRAQMPEHVEGQWRALFSEVEAQLQKLSAASPSLPAGMPLVSICIPHHESPDSLRAALDSLQQQTYTHFEIIVVDDGSTSIPTLNALNVLEQELAQQGGSLIRQENAYPGAARNRAVMAAKGEYLLFMDDDNLAMPHELETFVAVAQRTDADILTTVSAVFTGRQPPEHPKYLWLPLGGATGAGVYRNVFGDTNSFWKRSAFHAVGGFTEDYGIGHEDWEIFAKAVLMGLHLELVPNPLFWYRATIGGVQTAGDMAAYHARNTRPFLEYDPHGLGMLAAHAGWTYFSKVSMVSGPIIRSRTRWRTALILLSRVDLFMKFRIAFRRYGLKTAMRLAVRYIRNHSS